MAEVLLINFVYIFESNFREERRFFHLKLKINNSGGFVYENKRERYLQFIDW